MMTDQNTYQTDFAAWAERQAALLHHAFNQIPFVFDGIDVDNLMEEIEDLGRSDILRVKSLIRQALSRALTICLDAQSQAVPHWKREVITFVLDASEAYAPSYNNGIEMSDVWEKAQREAAVALLEYNISPPKLPDECPVDLPWLMSETFTVDGLIFQLQVAIKEALRSPPR